MLRMGLVGIGWWGGTLTASVQGKSDKVAFVSASARELSRHRDFADKHGVRLASFEETLAASDVDAVLLATPHSEHHDQVMAAVQAGKHVFVEKPLALNRADAESAIAACRDRRLAIGHGLNRRFSPAFAALSEYLESGQLGTLLHVEGQFSGPSGFRLKPGMWRADPSECPAGAMMVRGIHPLDCLIHFAGPVANVFAHSDRRVLEVPVDDVTSALLRFGRGVTGYIASHHATGEIWRVQLYGSKGWVEMPNEFELVFQPVGGELQRRSFPEIDLERAELEAFADAVAGIAPFPVTDAEAINAVATVEAMAASAARGEPVAIA